MEKVWTDAACPTWMCCGWTPASPPDRTLKSACSTEISSRIDLFRGACAVKGNVQVAGHVKPAPFSRHDVTLGDVDGSLFHIKI